MSCRVVTAIALVLGLGAAPAAEANHDLLSLVSPGSVDTENRVDNTGTSEDGSRYFFSTREPYDPADTDGQEDLYERTDAGVFTRLSTSPTAGNGPFGAFYVGSSKDGTHVFFETGEQLMADDNDSMVDIYERAGGNTALVSGGPPSPSTGTFYAGASDDGTRVFFHTDGALVPQDTDTMDDIYERSGGITTLLTPGTAEVPRFAGNSPDGTHVYFTTIEPLAATDTDTGSDVYDASGGTFTHVSTGPAAGAGNFTATFGGVSQDGSKVFFVDGTQLVSEDTDNGWQDVYERSGGTTTLVSKGPLSPNSGTNAVFGKATPDGSHVFFGTAEALTADDADPYDDVYDRSGGTTTLVTTSSAGVFGAAAFFVAAADDASRVIVQTTERLVPADTDSRPDLYEYSGATPALLSTGLSGGNGAFDPFFRGASADASRVFFETTEPLLAGDTDTAADLYERHNGETSLLSIGPAGGNSNTPGGTGTVKLSKDGSHVFFQTNQALVGSDTDTFLDLYLRSVGAGYPRPKGATPLRVPLVPAFATCASPNSTHGAPLAFGSCNPPAQTSPNLTVGTPDANGAAANSAGTVLLQAQVGAPGPPDDSDLLISLTISDVRCNGATAPCGAANAAGGADYTGELELRDLERITDRGSGPGDGDAATVTDTPLSATASCTGTASTAVGSSCLLSTTYDTMVPGAIVDGKRLIAESGGIEVLDGGSDGIVSTTPNARFATQGLFVP